MTFYPRIRYILLWIVSSGTNSLKVSSFQTFSYGDEYMEKIKNVKIEKSYSQLTNPGISI